MGGEPGDVLGLVGMMKEGLKKEHQEWLETHTEEAYSAVYGFPFLDAQVHQASEKIKAIEEKILGLEARLQSKKRQEARDKLWYWAPFTLVVAFTAYLVVRGWAAHPTVAIDFNVGEIVGGLLAGFGALAAGVSYALSRRGQ